MKICNLITLIFILTLSFYTTCPCQEPDQQRNFAQFSVILPPGWSGDETTGFISDDPDEYMLTLTRRMDDAIQAQVSVYLLPNKPGKTAEESALILTESQGETTKPVKEGALWTFMGEPRTHTLKGRGQTWVNANADRLLIIMAQDSDNTGANAIVKSLAGNTPQSRELLGR